MASNGSSARRAFPEPLARIEIHRQQVPRGPHQHHVVDHQRMHARQHPLILVLFVIVQLLEHGLDVGVIRRRHPPPHAQQRLAAVGDGVAGRIAADHGPAIDAGHLGRRRHHQGGKPGDRRIVAGQQRRFLAADLDPRVGMPGPQRGERLPGLLGRRGPQPTGGQRRGKRRLELLRDSALIAQSLQHQSPGQGPTVVEVVQTQEERRFIAGPRMKEPPRDLGQPGDAAAGDGLVEHLPARRRIATRRGPCPPPASAPTSAALRT